jgi:sporulation protein YqfC
LKKIKKIEKNIFLDLKYIFIPSERGRLIIMSKFDRLFEIPEEVANSVPKLTILNFDKMLIENYKCILEYQEFFIRIKMTNGILDINGFNLELNEMTRDDVIVTGTIDSIDFEKFKEEEIKVGKK